jgi:acyl-CoA synthetase (AMP-forming)/AMP-acid ligase II
MVPRFIEFRSELPRTDTHKVAKRLLREEGVAGITPTTIDVEEMRACST